MHKALVLIAAAFVAACSSSSAPSTSGNPNDGALAPPAIGMQIASTPVTVAAGAEQYLCWSFKVPAGAPLAVVGTELALPTKGMHHYAIFTNSAPMPANPTAYDCSDMGPTWGLVSGGGQGTPGLQFPDGTAMTLAAGTQVILQLHLLNAGATALDMPVAAINLVGSDAPNLQPVGVLIAGTLNITIPPHQTAVAINGGCAVDAPLENIFAVFPHMHTLGTHIDVTLQKKGSTGAPTALLDRGWNFGEQGVYATQASAATGDQVAVTCTYSNPSSNTVHFGLSTHDEMCLGVLYYYPAVQPSKYCGLVGGGP